MSKNDSINKELHYLFRPLRGTISNEILSNYFSSMLFYKYLSDNLEQYFNRLIEKDSLLLCEAYNDEKYKNILRNKALTEFGYFLEYDLLFSNIFIGENKDKHVDIIKLTNALNQISNSSLGLESERIFSKIFNNIDLSSPDLGKTLEEKENNLTLLLVTIDKICSIKGITIESVFDRFIDYFSNIKHLFSRFDTTEKSLNKLLTAIAVSNNNNAKTIYDPFLGTGNSLLNVYNCLNEPSIYGQEINYEKYNLALMNFLIHGVNYKQLNLLSEDTISSPGFLGKSFDIIVSVPPFGLRYEVPETGINCPERFGDIEINKVITRSDFLMVMHMIYYLNERGIIVTLVPQSSLARGGFRDLNIKENIIENNYLDAVIDLPSRLCTFTSIPLSILVFRKDRKDKKDVLFINASKEFEKRRRLNVLKDEHINKIVDTYVNRKEIDNFSSLAGLDEIKKNKFNLTIARYMDTYEGEYIKLEDTVTLKRKLNTELTEVNKKIEKLTKELNLDKEVDL